MENVDDKDDGNVHDSDQNKDDDDDDDDTYGRPAPWS
jgi:hypothetical protein